MAREDHRRGLRAIIRAGCPDREPGWLAFLQGGTVPCVTDVEAKDWLPQALRAALIHCRYRSMNLPPLHPCTRTAEAQVTSPARVAPPRRAEYGGATAAFTPRRQPQPTLALTPLRK